MIKVVKGDVTKAEEDIIAHQVNCRGVMGSGVARHIRAMDNNVFKQYREKYEMYNNKEDLLGQIQLVKLGNNKYVANLFGQLNYGRRSRGEIYTSYAAIDECFRKLRERAEELEMTVAMPYKIGSDRGGADWNKIYEYIEKHFKDYGITLYKFG